MWREVSTLKLERKGSKPLQPLITGLCSGLEWKGLFFAQPPPPSPHGMNAHCHVTQSESRLDFPTISIIHYRDESQKYAILITWCHGLYINTTLFFSPHSRYTIHQDALMGGKRMASGPRTPTSNLSPPTVQTIAIEIPTGTWHVVPLATSTGWDDGKEEEAAAEQSRCILWFWPRSSAGGGGGLGRVMPVWSSVMISWMRSAT